MRLCVAFLVAVLLAGGPMLSVIAAAPGEEESTYVPPLADAVLEARAKALQKELRCLVCQGQSIDESNAPLATDLRRLIREQIQAGQSDAQIKDFLVVRYGIFILMQPPVRNDTYFLWFVPVLLLVAGGAAIGATILRSRRRLSSEPISEGLDSTK
jgi:cytochrome c-type biogenesis protein CcmH